MKYNLNAKILGLKGEEIPQSETVKDAVDLRFMLVTSLQAGGREEKEENKKYARYVLLNEITKAKDSIDFSPEQVVDLKSLVNECYTGVLFGRTLDILNQK